MSTPKLKFVCLKYPCNACLIVQDLLTEVLGKVSAQTGAACETVTLDRPNQAYTVPGLEVEKFPAIIIDDEQVTAGDLVPTRKLLQILGDYVN